MFNPKIELDRDLFDRCKQLAKKLGYHSTKEFIIHALEKELRKHTINVENTDEEINKQLKGLGYIQ